MQRSDERIPPSDFQPDPQLHLSEGRATGMQIAIVTLACAFILGLMIYGLGRTAETDGNIMASAPRAQTTGAATPAEPAAPQQQPAQQPVPQQTKPGVVEDDSSR